MNKCTQGILEHMHGITMHLRNRLYSKKELRLVSGLQFDFRSLVCLMRMGQGSAMVVRPVLWSSAILYVFLALHLHQAFFDAETFSEANKLCSNPPECTMYCLGLATFPPCGTCHLCQGRRFFSSQLSLYPNSDSTFNLIRLTTSGDINPNHGPSNNGNSAEQCSVFQKTVTSSHCAITCDLWNHWCHINQ